MSRAARPTPPEPHPADSHGLIRVHGARVNNLKDVDLEIPKRRLTVFTGVSGSGKCSLVFGTIATESQRLINETYSAFVQGFMPTLAAPTSTCSRASPPRSSSTRSAWAPTSARPSAPPPTPTPCCASCSAGSASRTSARRRRSRSTSRPISGAGAVTIEKGGEHDEGAAQLQHHRRHVPALRGPGRGQRRRPDAAVRRLQVARRRAPSRSPATAWTAGTGASSPAAASSTRTSRSGTSPRSSCTTCSTRSPRRSRSRAST